MHKKSYPLHTVIAAVAIAFVIGVYTPLPHSFFGPAEGNGISSAKENGPQITPEIKNLDEVWETLHKDYYNFDKANRTDLESSAVRGFVEGLNDPYTVYMTPEESKEFSSDLAGKLEGIGAEMEVHSGAITVVNVLKKSPAEGAGLQPHDIILKINDEDTSKMKFIDAIKKIRGPKGTPVTLTVYREGEEDDVTLTITRDTITVASVEATTHPGKIVQLSVNQFNDTTITDFNEILQDMLLDKPNGIIVDLRNNGGGYLETAVDFLSFILPPDTLAVTVKKRDPKKDKTLKTTGSGPLGDIPVVVLINKFSASASEIVAGAIQDHKRGALIGEKSYGKGTVQELKTLTDGSLLRLTIAKWFTPNGRSIDQTGLEPDLAVSFTKEDKAAGKDPQLDAALKELRK
ncbi:S41 family peptidase [Candidatus Gracilibacteria bacterium]|nr:S41 family peptidase [Candidatus Gracilibacteria bacterium]